jgi:hypothetical protein
MAILSTSPHVTKSSVPLEWRIGVPDFLNMASPTSQLNNVNIDPEANLSIYLYLRDGSQCIPMSFPRKSRSPASPTTPGSPTQLSLEHVMDMNLEQLDHLQERICQMEISNYGLLTRIYGRFNAHNQPFPIVVASRLSTPDYPEQGTTKHRRLLFSQYKNMLAIARDPTRCVSLEEPATASGAKALQDYQMQLLLLAEQRRKHLKRKSEDESRPEREPRSPRIDTGLSRPIRKSSKVLDLEPRPVILKQEGKEVILNNKALADYQQQLMLLEEQNRKRLQLAKHEQETARATSVRVHEVYGEVSDDLDHVRSSAGYPIRVRNDL